MELGLVGKAAVVIGASQGLGRAIALELAREGVKLALVARNAAALEALAAEIASEFGLQGVAIAADLTDRGAAASCVEQAMQSLGGLDLLVNCAGATKRGDFFVLTDDDWESCYALKIPRLRPDERVHPGRLVQLPDGSDHGGRVAARPGRQPVEFRLQIRVAHRAL